MLNDEEIFNILTAILINVITIALLRRRLLSLHVQNDPVHHSCDSHEDLRHVLWNTFLSRISVFYIYMTGNTNQGVPEKFLYVQLGRASLNA